MTAHPAVAAILDAEGTPAFQFETDRVERLLATATRTQPETLPDRWVARLCLRLADVCVQADALDTDYLRLWARELHVADILEDLLKGRIKPKQT